MDGYQKAIALLPPALYHPLSVVSVEIRNRVQEIRLRAGQAVSLGYEGKEWYVTNFGNVVCDVTQGVRCTGEQLHRIADRIAEYSVYAHGEEMRRGFVTSEGCRIGIAGTAISEHGQVKGYRSLTSLCIRVAREHSGCAASLAGLLCDDRVHSALICSEPAGGKTSLLRDLAVQFVRRRLPVTVVDERGELAIDSLLDGCDVLRYTPKHIAVEQAVRCLAPRVILMDEIGDLSEWQAVREASLRGVPTVATVHCQTPDELLRRDDRVYNVLQNGVFEHLVLLRGRYAPGQIGGVWRTEEWLRENARCNLIAGGRHREWDVGLQCTATSYCDVGTV